MPKNNKTEPEQLQLFPHWDPRQLPLFPSKLRTVVPVFDDLDRCDAPTGPMNERIWDAEFGT